MDPIIHTYNLNKSFGRKHVLQDLNLEIPRGSVFGLLGKNGAGKTTLIKCCLGLLKANSGTISTLGDNPWDFQDSTKERLGYVPQSDRLYPWLTVRQLIDYTASFYSRWNRSLVDQLLKEWEVDANEKMGVLSEGQAQKVAIILSLGHEPELLIFDEPVASLDPSARRKFLKMVLDLVSERECTFFFSTHIMSDIERVADQVAIQNNGQIQFSGGLDTLKDTVKRLRVIAEGVVPDDWSMLDVIHMEKRNHEAILTVRGYKEEVKTAIEQVFHAQVTVEDLNLEEIFLELTR